MCYTKAMLVAVDTGGTKTLVAVFDVDGALQQASRFPTPHDTAEYVTQLVKVINELVGDGNPSIISAAIPGIIQGTTAISCGNLPWKNFDIAAALKPHFDAKVLLENDANLAGLSEVRALQNTPERALYITVSTGIGTGIITDGKINHGMRLSEGGHMLLEYNGNMQIWESFGAGSAIYKHYRKYARDITDEKDWLDIADRISRGLLTCIPLLQPEIIIIGGSVGTYFERYEKQLTAILEEKIDAYIPLPRIIQAKHPEEAVIYGCYYYAVEQPADN